MSAPCGANLMRDTDHWIGRFVAMGSPCEVRIDEAPAATAREILDLVASEAWRVGRKYSRCRPDSTVYWINANAGHEVEVDDECAELLDLAAGLTRLSDGAFDITSSVLRQASPPQIDELLQSVGWHRIEWHRPVLKLSPGMQIDFGDLAKGYAVDSARQLVEEIAPGLSCLIDFGADVAVCNPRHADKAWRVGIASCARMPAAERIVQLSHGALATGNRYSHILDARTGQPVRNAPRSVTVAADTCAQASTLTTLAMLQGENAERMLRESGMRYWLH
jgi:thiamine biosynthesis lipoprotein